MRKSVVVLLVATGVASAAAGAAAQEAAQWLGAVRSHRAVDRFDMSVGVTAGESPRLPVRFTEDREVWKVPSFYGSLVAVTGDTHTAVLWYRDDGGTLRNAVLADPAARSYEVRCEPVSRRETDLRDK